MKVVCRHYVDTDPVGRRYHYEYCIYNFSAGPLTQVARSYVDTAQSVCFISKLVEDHAQAERLSVDDLSTELFVAALDYLRGEGKREFSWLDHDGPGYCPVPMVDPATIGG